MSLRHPPALVNDVAGIRYPGARRRPFVVIAVVVVLVVMLDALIGAVRGTDPEREATPPDGAHAVRHIITDIASSKRGFLLLGDSVLAGDALRSRVEKWWDVRVVDAMGALQNPDDETKVVQIALDGMLPVDMLAIVRQLDAHDPGGKVGVVVEINPRYFSRHYAAHPGCTRSWLDELARGAANGDGLDGWDYTVAAVHELTRSVIDRLPLVRHRDLLEGRLYPSRAPELLRPRRKREPDELAGRARILEHYRELAMDEGSTQIAALRELVLRLRASGRPALFFATPLNDRFFAGELDGANYGAVIAALDRIIDDKDDDRIELISFDHPRFAPELFIDHAHMLPAGNRLLALNLMHALGIGFADVPDRDDLVYAEGPDATLVGHVERGSSDGAPWQAAVRHPDGIAVAEGGRRLVIADTGNHCLRELVGLGYVVRTLAGHCGTRGVQDGSLVDARLHAPRSPAFLGDALWFSDGKGARLRRLGDGVVTTQYVLEGPQWSRIELVRADEERVYVQDGPSSILRYDPATHTSEEMVSTEVVAIAAFDVAPDGRLFVADDTGRVWFVERPGARIGATADGVALLFENTASEAMPQGDHDYYPFEFEAVRLARIVGMRWVERYGGLLVQDDLFAAKSPRTVTERIHLRYLDLDERMVYPWLKPLVHGSAYVFRNGDNDSWATNVHVGSMALDQASATLFYAERERSRVLRLSDGLLGTAKIGNHITPVRYGGFKDVFGSLAGHRAWLRFRPELGLSARIERVPRRGPYLAVMFGSSMTAVTDTVGQYSLGRAIEERMADTLALRDGVRFDLFQRAYRGPSLTTLVDGFVEMVEQGGRFDVVIFEVHGPRMHQRMARADVIEQLTRIADAAARTGALVLFLDNDAMSAVQRDGLRSHEVGQRKFIEIAREAGFYVVDPSDMLLDDNLRAAPWGNPPFERPHGTTWAIDLTAQAFTALAYPAVRDHLRGRVPALHRSAHSTSVLAAERLLAAFEAVEADWGAVARISSSALSHRVADGELEVFVDLQRAGVTTRRPAALDRTVLAALVETIVRDPGGALAVRAVVRLARFPNYDEYGQGVREAARVVHSREFDRAALEVFLRAQAK